ncbi:hypothetical protein [Aestuariivivens marinum]|uniref:hypothetical protein n=1 Tax=Aestuariivivens marinum TaxID=2913555 RepID=UPI001F59FCB4|nr:hypothetical protein [Aestuariivivens marinum]
MATVKPITHVYKEINVGKYKSVKHYELIECNGTQVFSKLINISKNQNCAQSTPIYWLRIREKNKWTNYVTGLFKTCFPSIYKGDTQRKKNLVIFKFSRDESSLIIDFFKGYYTKDLSNILPQDNV